MFTGSEFPTSGANEPLIPGTKSRLSHSRHMGDTSNPRHTKSIFYWRIFAKDADRRIARAIRTSVGNRLRETYSRLVQERLPPKIADLLSRLDRNPPANGG